MDTQKTHGITWPDELRVLGMHAVWCSTMRHGLQRFELSTRGGYAAEIVQYGEKFYVFVCKGAAEYRFLDDPGIVLCASRADAINKLQYADGNFDQLEAAVHFVGERCVEEGYIDPLTWLIHTQPAPDGFPDTRST